jgi:hypothetical protein
MHSYLKFISLGGGYGLDTEDSFKSMLPRM